MSMEKFFLMLVLLPMVGCSHGSTHWINHELMGDSNPMLICDSTGMIVADILEHSPSVWTVYGGNGAVYGTFEAEDEAKKKAETLVTNGYSLRMGSAWLTCKQ